MQCKYKTNIPGEIPRITWLGYIAEELIYSFHGKCIVDRFNWKSNARLYTIMGE